MTFDEADKLKGKLFDSFAMIINHNADVYYRENGKLIPLFFLRKKIIPVKLMSVALDSFKAYAKKSSCVRTVASGNNGNKRHVRSMIAGYYDQMLRCPMTTEQKKHNPKCRITNFTKMYKTKWQRILPMITLVDGLYKYFMPNNHAEQLKMAQSNPEFQIESTAFSTLTINHNWQTACHVDSGDYRNGYSALLVATEGEYNGGYLGFPQFDIGANVKNGDFILINPHMHHANTPIIPKTLVYTRLSIVFYYREGLCNT
jgi:hypothetical protein